MFIQSYDIKYCVLCCNIQLELFSIKTIDTDVGPKSWESSGCKTCQIYKVYND